MGSPFCKKVYDWFNQVRATDDGITKLRLRPSKDENRLLEELIPLARYVQARHREGRRVRVQWYAGSQPYDAVLSSVGVLVDNISSRSARVRLVSGR